MLAPHSVSISLIITGAGAGERWSTLLRWEPFTRTERCCPDGHWTPEAAASHGAERAVVSIAQAARSLPPGTAGGDLLAKSA